LHSQQLQREQQQREQQHNQHQQHGEQQEVQGGGDGTLVDDTTEEYTPSTPVIIDNDILAPSTTQYAPLDSPDASPINSKREEEETSEVNNNNNMQMNSLSVKLGVTPYTNPNGINSSSNNGDTSNHGKSPHKKGDNNNNNNNNNNKRGGGKGELSRKTMSMLFLDIEPGQSRGPNLITLDPIAADDDVDSGREGERGGASCGDDRGDCRNSGDGNSNSSSGGDGEEGDQRSVSGSVIQGEDKQDEGNSSSNNVVEQKEEGEGHSERDLPRSDTEELHLQSPSSPTTSLHQAQSHSLPTLTTTSSTIRETNNEVTTEDDNTKETTHNHVVEESLECQAYTPSHLEALRLRREAGKGRAYSCNDAVISAPPATSSTQKKFVGTTLPTVTSPVWKPTFAALNGGGEDESMAVAVVGGGEGEKQISADTTILKVSSGDGGDTIKGENDISSIPELIMPDLNASGIIPTKRKESCGSATSAGGTVNNTTLPPVTSSSSIMSTDARKTPKIGNVRRDNRANSIASSFTKERSQSVSSAKSKDSGSGTTTTDPSSNSKKDKKSSESKPSSSSQPDNVKNKTMSSYVINDLLNIDSRNHDGSATEDIDANMEEFLRIPSKLEYLMLFSLAVCVDSFLYVWAMLPLKFIWGVICLTCTLYKMIQTKKWRLRPEEEFHGIGFHRRHLYAILQSLLIWLVYSQILCPISIGKLYHWIRGQAMLKLYVLIAIVEVFDRLLCSFGQDAWDSLYWNTTRRPRHPRLFVSIIVVGVYVTIHSLFLFVHVATLSVAVNSADNALLTLLISGNFAEIKSTVFKKYNKQNLFKITTSDICERFKLALFLLLILFLNRFQGEMTSSMVNDYYLMCGIVFAAELVSDWIKHSFITKFNFIKSTAYFDYALVLSGDVTGIGHEGLSLDYTHAAVKRLGLAQIPLVCVTARYLHEAVRFAIAYSHGDMDHPFSSLVDLMADGSKWKFCIGLLKCMGGLVLFKVFLGIGIRAVARRHLGGDSRVSLKDSKGMTSSLSSKAPKVKDHKETTETKKKQ
jgi:hypothetical protein